MEVYEDWPDAAIFRGHIEDFRPFMVTNAKCVYPLDCMLHNDTVVDISRIDSSTGATEFHGDPSKRDFIKASLSSFVEAFQATQTNASHPLTDSSSSSLFLSQALVYSSDPTQSLSIIPGIGNTLKPPLILSDSELYESSVWMNLSSSRSALHYDGNHNLLTVSQGAKEVILISPAHTERLAPYSAFHETPNHSLKTYEEIATFLPQLKVLVNAGSAIFIPEGWWHHVSSLPCTFAVNFWFRSPLHQLQSKLPHMTPYLLRANVHALYELFNAEARKTVLADSALANTKVFSKMLETDFYIYMEALLLHHGKNPPSNESVPFDFTLCSLVNQKRLWLPFSIIVLLNSAVTLSFLHE